MGGTPKASDRPARGAEPTLILPADRAPPFWLRLKAGSTLMPIWGPARPRRPPRVSLLLLLLVSPALPQAPPILTIILPRPASPRPYLLHPPSSPPGAQPQAPAPPLASEKLGCPSGHWQQTWWGHSLRPRAASAQVSCGGGARGPRAQSQAGRWAPRAGWGGAWGGPWPGYSLGSGEMGRIHSDGREGRIWTQRRTWGP